MLLLIILTLGWNAALGQPIDVTATPSFSGQSRLIVGTQEDGVVLDCQPVSLRIDPPATSLADATLGQVRVQVNGNPFTLRTQVDTSFTIRIAQAGGSGTLEGRLRTVYAFLPVLMIPRPVLQLDFEPSALAFVDGVTYSRSPANPTVLWDAAFAVPPTATVPVMVRMTRQQLRATPSSVRITSAGSTSGAFGEQQVELNLSPNSVDGGGQFVKWTLEGNNVLRLRAFHDFRFPGRTRTLIRVRKEGLRPLDIPVDVELVPSQGAVFVEGEVDFFHRRGTPEPAPVTVAVRTPDTFYILPTSWDPGWLNPQKVSNTSLLLTPIMANKNLGSHRTPVALRSGFGLETEVYVNFFVNDGPGEFLLSSQPAQGGSITATPNATQYVNGTRVELRAVPASGYVFARWRGSINDVANPITVTANGRSGITAEFLPVVGGCTYTLRPEKVVASQGDIGKVEVFTQPGCQWFAEGSLNLMRFRDAAGGIGSGDLRYIGRNHPWYSEEFVKIANRYLMIQNSTPDCGTGYMAAPGLLGWNEPSIAFRTTACGSALRVSQPWLRPPPERGAYKLGREVLLTVDSNTSNVPRAAAIEYGGLRVPVIQAARDWVAPFADVASTHPFAQYIALLKHKNGADSCGADLFCPDVPVLRSEMAELLVRGILEGAENFEYPRTPMFEDVPATHPKFKWIQKLAELNITSGCTLTRYCPGDRVTRGQMASFLARAKTGLMPGEVFSSLDLPSQYGRDYLDVGQQHLFRLPIEIIRRLGVTSGCYDNAYCPEESTTRGQMAVFLVRAFFTP